MIQHYVEAKHIDQSHILHESGKLDRSEMGEIVGSVRLGFIFGHEQNKLVTWPQWCYWDIWGYIARTPCSGSSVFIPMWLNHLIGVNNWSFHCERFMLLSHNDDLMIKWTNIYGICSEIRPLGLSARTISAVGETRFLPHPILPLKMSSSWDKSSALYTCHSQISNKWHNQYTHLTQNHWSYLPSQNYTLIGWLYVGIR